MAKKEKRKYKNIKLEQNELVSTPIGMFENRRISSVSTVIILGIFILAVIFMPQIYEYINAYLNPKTPTPIEPSTPIKPSVPDDIPSNDDHFSPYTETLSIVTDDIIVNNIVVNKETNTISYDVTNNLTKSQNLEELNYYLEIFNTEQTLLERVKLADDYNVASGAFRHYEKEISSDSATTIGFLSLPKKTTQDYPLVELKNAEDGNGSLVCTKDNEKVTYKFVDNKLKELTSEISYLSSIPNYAESLQTNQLQVSVYNNKIGIASTLFEYEAGYNITTNVNLNETERLYIFSADSFKLDTEPKVVKFEAEAQRFKCE